MITLAQSLHGNIVTYNVHPFNELWLELRIAFTIASAKFVKQTYILHDKRKNIWFPIRILRHGPKEVHHHCSQLESRYSRSLKTVITRLKFSSCVPTILLSKLTIQAPTCLFGSLERAALSTATDMKYSSLRRSTKLHIQTTPTMLNSQFSWFLCSYSAVHRQHRLDKTPCCGYRILSTF